MCIWISNRYLFKLQLKLTNISYKTRFPLLIWLSLTNKKAESHFCNIFFHFRVKRVLKRCLSNMFDNSNFFPLLWRTWVLKVDWFSGQFQKLDYLYMRLRKSRPIFTWGTAAAAYHRLAIDYCCYLGQGDSVQSNHLYV